MGELLAVVVAHHNVGVFIRMKRILIVAVAALLAPSRVSAADLPVRTGPPAYYPVAAVHDWGGTAGIAGANVEVGLNGLPPQTNFEVPKKQWAYSGEDDNWKRGFAQLQSGRPAREGHCRGNFSIGMAPENLFTYDLAQRARARRASIESEVIPPMRYLGGLSFLDVPESVPDPENPTPQQLRAGRRRADKRIQIELGAARELVDLGDVATFEYLDKRLAIPDRLDAMINRLYKKLAYVRAIKSMLPPAMPALPAPSQPLLENGP